MLNGKKTITEVKKEEKIQQRKDQIEIIKQKIETGIDTRLYTHYKNLKDLIEMPIFLIMF